MLIDTHAHLAWEDFSADRDAVLARARAAGVHAIVTIGIDLESDARCVELADRHPELWAAVGIHPNDSRAFTDAEWDRLESLARHPRVVAIGETGLDWYRDSATPEHQRESFRRQLDLARRLDKPVVIHCRDAMADVLAVLRAEPAPVRAVMHCFSGDEKDAAECAAMGLYLSFAGPLTYPKAEALRRAAAAAPEDRIFVETDCPFLAPQERRGKRNEPAYVAATARRLAEVRGVPFEDLARRTTENARRFFGALPAGS